MSILEVKNVSIRYMTGDFKEIGLKEFVMRKLRNDYKVVEFWADRNISFSLEEGDMLGIIGTNGAGKTTLLKAISGIMEPTRGKVKRKGTIAALLALGSGFDGDLTVRENIYLRGAMLGYTRKFMDETYESIIDFAELREFEHRPFKQLSSGMKSRLAFSIASLVRPDILILDEVLSVGDGAFKKKSETKMKEIISGGATTILVSHSIGQVRELCNKILWLHKGEQIEFGEDVQGICDRYEEYIRWGVGVYPKGTNEVLRRPVFADESRTSSFDIVGCCVARDIFGFHTDSTQYAVKRFIQSNSPISMLSPSLEEIGAKTLDLGDCVAPNQFWKKVFLTDVNKDGFLQLKESGADWLILDISEIKFNLAQFTHEKTGKATCTTAIRTLWNSLSKARENGKLDNCKVKAIDILSVDEQKILDSIREYVAELQEIYPGKRIILLEVCSQLEYYTAKGLRLFESWERLEAQNRLIRSCFEEVKRLLPHSWLIPMPDGVYCVETHKWGKDPRHFDGKYYEYALKAVNVITGDGENKQERLDALHKVYSEWFHARRAVIEMTGRQCLDTN